MTPETALKNQVMIECGKLGWRCYHQNVGKFKIVKYNTVSGKNEISWFDTGIPTGTPDLVILTGLGHAVYVETKIHPRKPSKEQIEWLNWLNDNNYYARCIYNVDEFNNLVDEIIEDFMLGREAKKVYLDEKGNVI